MTVPNDDQEVQRRTVRGIARWLGISTAAFWLAFFLFAVGIAENQAGAVLAGCYYGMLASIVGMVLGYLFVLLEPATLSDRRGRVLLSASFATLILFSGGMLLETIYADPPQGQLTVWRALSIVGMAAAATTFTIALARGCRLLFAAAFLLLIVANLLYAYA